MALVSAMGLNTAVTLNKLRMILGFDERIRNLDEKRLDISDYSANDKRVFGFVSERLFDVWLEQNQIKCKDIPYIFLEKENWITKGVNFILRKMNKKQITA